MTESQSAFLLFVLFVMAQIIVCSLAVWLVLGWQARREIIKIKIPPPDDEWEMWVMLNSGEDKRMTICGPRTEDEALRAAQQMVGRHGHKILTLKKL